MLAPPARPGIFALDVKRKLYLSLFDEGDFIDLLPVDRSILIETASFREVFPQRLADSIPIASALSAECRYFVSFDRNAKRLPQSLTWVTPKSEEVSHLLKALDA